MLQKKMGEEERKKCLVKFSKTFDKLTPGAATCNNLNKGISLPDIENTIKRAKINKVDLFKN